MKQGSYRNELDGVPRLLIVENAPDIVRSMVSSLDRPCCDPQVMLANLQGPARLSFCTCEGTDGVGCGACCIVVADLTQLHLCDLNCCDVVLCASSLPDGSGLDALAYVRGIRPTLPIMLTGDPEDTPLAIEAIRAGASDFLVTTGNDLRLLPLSVEKCLAHQRIRLENDRLQDDLSRSLSETAIKNRQLQTLIKQLEAMARTDELTRLYNRRWLNLMLERAWSEAIRNGQPLGLGMIDLDGFKSINDELGHQRGDELLRLVGKVISANCRQVDFAARYGGDEFSILMPNTNASDSEAVLRRIVDAFEYAVQNSMWGGSGIGMSVGLSHIELSRPVNADQLVTHADEALYVAKSSGRNRIVVRRAEGAIAAER